MTKDIILYSLGILVTIVPIMREIRKKEKNWFYVSFIIICFGLILWLGLNKINRDKDAEENNQTTIGSLNTQLMTVRKSYSADSLRDIQFQNALLTKFKIRRDSLTNQPYLLKAEKIEINSNTGTNLGNIGGANNEVTNNFGPKPREVTDKILQEVISQMPHKNIGVAILARVNDQESNEFKVKLKEKLIERGYRNAFVSGTIDDRIIGDDVANLKKQKEYTVTFSDGQYNIAIPGNQ